MKIWRLLLVAGLVACAGSTALAQTYAGLGVGPSQISINCAGTSSCDRTDTGFKAYVGWMSSWSLAVEGVYFDWGRAKSLSPIAGGTQELKTRASGLGAGAAYFVHFLPGECVVRLGLASNWADTTVTTNGSGVSNTHSELAPYYGTGCAYSFAPRWWLTADIDLSRVKYTAVDKATTRLITLGVRWGP